MANQATQIQNPPSCSPVIGPATDDVRFLGGLTTATRLTFTPHLPLAASAVSESETYCRSHCRR